MHHGEAKCGQDVMNFIALLEKGACPNARNSRNELTRHYLGFEADDNVEHPLVLADVLRIRKLLKDWEHQHGITLKHITLQLL